MTSWLSHLRLGFVGQDEARFDGFQQDFVARLTPAAIRGVVEVQPRLRVVFAVDAHFQFAFAVQAAIFFVLPVGVVDKNQVVVAVLLVADGLAAPIAADAVARSGAGNAREKEECEEELLHGLL